MARLASAGIASINQNVGVFRQSAFNSCELIRVAARYVPRAQSTRAQPQFPSRAVADDMNRCNVSPASQRLCYLLNAIAPRIKDHKFCIFADEIGLNILNCRINKDDFNPLSGWGDLGSQFLHDIFDLLWRRVRNGRSNRFSRWFADCWWHIHVMVAATVHQIHHGSGNGSVKHNARLKGQARAGSTLHRGRIADWFHYFFAVE